MRKIKFQNKSVRKWIEEKEELVNQGRKCSADIEKVEKDLKDNETAQRKEMEKIKPEDLIKRGDELQAGINDRIETVKKKVGDKAFAEIQNMQQSNLLFIISCELARTNDFSLLPIVNELGDVVNKIHKLKLDAIPKSLKDENKSLQEKKADLEEKRNKIALKVQKIKDRMIPIIQKHVKPLLGEFEDMETATLQGENIVVQVYDRVEEFKEGFRKREKEASK